VILQTAVPAEHQYDLATVVQSKQVTVILQKRTAYEHTQIKECKYSLHHAYRVAYVRYA
jgi:hypothetical protein